jgi:restriction system protein
MVPDYQSLMLPLLSLAADGKEHRISDAITGLAGQLTLSDADLAQMLPSGKQTVFNNRVHWAKTYMAQAKLLEVPRRAHFRISARGKKVLDEKPSKIDLKLLEQFPEFLEFKKRGSETPKPGPTEAKVLAESETDGKSSTPDELLRTTIADLDAVLAGGLLDRILAAPPAFFENLIVELLLRMGYGGSREDAGRAIGKSGDGGIDGVIDQDPLGLDRVYLQAKRYSRMHR